MATIKQVKNKLRHKRLAEEITECQSSGMSSLSGFIRAMIFDGC